jgi:hypothetical protein
MPGTVMGLSTRFVFREIDLVLHEILFSDRGRRLIKASDLVWEWKVWEWKPLN